MNTPRSHQKLRFSIHKTVMSLVFDRKGTLFPGRANLYSPIRPTHLVTGVMP